MYSPYVLAHKGNNLQQYQTLTVLYGGNYYHD